MSLVLDSDIERRMSDFGKTYLFMKCGFQSLALPRIFSGIMSNNVKALGNFPNLEKNPGR
jgi:hypothetical protein